MEVGVLLVAVGACLLYSRGAICRVPDQSGLTPFVLNPTACQPDGLALTASPPIAGGSRLRRNPNEQCDSRHDFMSDLQRDESTWSAFLPGVRKE